MRRLTGPWHAWLLIIVLLYAWKGERGAWIGTGIAVGLWLLSLLDDMVRDWLRRRKSN
jgi:hypothetical protein